MLRLRSRLWVGGELWARSASRQLCRSHALRTPLSPGRSHLDKLAAQVGPWAGGSVRDCLGLGWGLSMEPREDHWVGW